MKPVDTLFGIGSVAALAAGIAEIRSAREKWQNNEARNALTPFFMMCVKALRIPKFAVLARTGAGAFPLISAACAFLIWTIAWYYNISKSPAADRQVGTTPAHHPVGPARHPPAQAHHPVGPAHHPARNRGVAPPGLSEGSFDSSWAS